jgi:hypothetical protein
MNTPSPRRQAPGGTAPVAPGERLARLLSIAVMTLCTVYAVSLWVLSS